MKKLNKFINLLPAVAIAFVSGLVGLLSNDQTIKEAKADNSVLISNRSVTNYNLHFTDSSYSDLVWDWYFDYEINFYQDLSANNFYFVLNVVNKLPQWSFTYEGNTKMSYAQENYTETIVSERMSLASTTFTSSLTFNVNSINTKSEANSYGEFLGDFLWLTTYKIEYTLTFPSSAGFTPRTVRLYSPAREILPGGFNYLGFSWDSDPDIGFMVNAPHLYNNPINIATYTVDYTQSNYDVGYNDGYSTGYNDGFNVGYDSGFSTGYNNGYDIGFSAGQVSRDNDVINAYNEGYQAGYASGYSVDTTVATIFSGVLQVGMLPVNVFLAIFNFEILGINLSAFISAILTVCLTVIVIRTIKGGGSSD